MYRWVQIEAEVAALPEMPDAGAPHCNACASQAVVDASGRHGTQSGDVQAWAGCVVTRRSARPGSPHLKRALVTDAATGGSAASANVFPWSMVHGSCFKHREMDSG